MSHELFEDVWPEEGECVYLCVYWCVWGGGGGITADSKRLIMNLPCKTRIIPILNNVWKQLRPKVKHCRGNDFH